MTITTTPGRFLPIGLLSNLHVLGSVIGVARNRVLCYEKMKDKREGGAHAARKHYDTRAKPSGEVDGLGPARGGVLSITAMRCRLLLSLKVALSVGDGWSDKISIEFAL